MNIRPKPVSVIIFPFDPKGLNAKTLKEKSRKHLASSTEDLLILHETEMRLISRLKKEKELPEVVKSYLNTVDYLE